ncbi:MAG TPA: hypothetical protein VF335_01060, partial [Chitinivibrionales bacterium]
FFPHPTANTIAAAMQPARITYPTPMATPLFQNDGGNICYNKYEYKIIYAVDHVVPPLKKNGGYNDYERYILHKAHNHGNPVRLKGETR